MNWWEYLGYDTEDRAYADGVTDTQIQNAKDELYKQSVETNNTPSSIVGGPKITGFNDNAYRSELDRNFIAPEPGEETVEKIVVEEVDEIETSVKYIIVQGPGGKYIKQEDAAGTYTDASVQAEIDRLNTQRDATLLAEKLKSGGSDTGGGGDYTPRTTDVDYTPVESTGLSTREEAKLRFPYLDERLIDVYVQGFIDTGDSQLAILQMRSDSLMETVYPGIKKSDGTLRMTEQEYIVAKEFMELELRSYNLNPQVFGDDIVEAISGDVSPQEFSERLQTGYQNIVQNIPQVREVYMREFNLDLNEESIFGMFVSPRLSTAVLDNQIRQSQIIAEAEVALGSSALTVAAARGLQQQGLSQEQARRGFQGASTILPGLSGGAERFGRGPISETEYVQATELGDQGIGQSIRRVESQITSASSAAAGAKQLRTGEVVGLEES